MHPVTHLLGSWCVANLGRLERRDRLLVTLAGVVPDLDGLGYGAEILTRNSEHPLHWFSDYHHVLLHNLGTAIAVVVASILLAQRKAAATILVLVAFHLHLLADLVGGKGPDGYAWPIPYLEPFAAGHEWVWSGQWRLDSWPNMLITLVLVGLTLYLGWRRGYSIIGLVSRRVDEAFVGVLRKRFGSPRQSKHPPCKQDSPTST